MPWTLNSERIPYKSVSSGLRTESGNAESAKESSIDGRVTGSQRLTQSGSTEGAGLVDHGYVPARQRLGFALVRRQMSKPH
jgi:hypothetical protein